MLEILPRGMVDFCYALVRALLGINRSKRTDKNLTALLFIERYGKRGYLKGRKETFCKGKGGESLR